MLRRLLLVEILAVAGLLAACGGSSGGGSDGNALTPEPDGTDFEMGVVTSSGAFREGDIFVGLTPLSAGGQTSLRVNVVDDDGRPITQPANVVFTSNCVSTGRATIVGGPGPNNEAGNGADGDDAPAAGQATTRTNAGVATATYVDRGCGDRTSEDTVTARAQVDNDIIEAQTKIMVSGSNAGAIEFVSADPRVLSLRNTGSSARPETATVRFRVLGSAGTPQANRQVDFSLFPGGNNAELITNSARSSDRGFVTARVRSGTVPTPFRVAAELAQGAGIATQSNLLSVGTGLPAQKGVSVSQSVFNPEALNYDGVEVRFTVQLADQFGNPVADGTAVNFTAEGGQISAGGDDGASDGDNGPANRPSCLTTNGTCSVTWRSSDPRPADGRISILAYALGEETLLDNNGNNRYDGRGSPDGFRDLSEAFRDDNYVDPRAAHNFTQNVDRFIDFNGNGIFDTNVIRGGEDVGDTGNGSFDGVLCKRVGGEPVNGCTGNLTHVYDHGLIVLAGSQAVINAQHSSDAGGLQSCGNLGRLTLANNGSGQLQLQLEDVNGNPMPAQTEVTVETSLGSIEGTDSPFILPNTLTTEPQILSYTVAGAGGDEPEQGTVSISVTTPGSEGPGADGLEFSGTTTSCSFAVLEAGAPEEDQDDSDFSPGDSSNG